MGKAAGKRQRGQSRYLAKIAETRPELFAEKWTRRIDSWLREIRLSIAEWKQGGEAAGERIFDIVNSAMQTLDDCGPAMYDQYAKSTYDTLCNEYCAGVAGLIDPRMYKLSNLQSMINSKRN